MAHAQISVEPYGGTETDDFQQFELLFRGYIGVAGIDPGQQANFLHLHLREAALRFYQTLPAAIRANVENSLTALRDHFCNPQLQEVHVLKLEQLRYDPKTDSPENFLVSLTNKAQRAYPTPDLPAVDPIDVALNGAPLVSDTAIFHRETAQRQERIDAVNDNGNEQIRRLFIKGMPNWLRSKLMEQPQAITVQELCHLTKKQIMIREVCLKEDYPEDGFNEVNDRVSENLISALTKLFTNQDQIEKQINEMRSQKAEQSMKQSNPPFQQNKNNTNQNGQFSGNQNQNNLPGQQQSGRKGKNRNNWQNQFGFSNNQPYFQNTGPIAPQQYPPWYIYQQYQNMQQNQPIVQIQPAQVQPNANYLQQQQHFTGNQTAQAEIQFPGGPFAPRVRPTAKRCDICGKFYRTANQCWWGQKHKDKIQRSCFQMSQKN